MILPGKGGEKLSSKPLFQQFFLRIIISMSLIYVFIIAVDLAVQVVDFRAEVKDARREYEEGQRALIKSEVEKVLRYILYQHDLGAREFRNLIQYRAMTGYRIVSRLHESYGGVLPQSRVEGLAVEALRSVAYEDGREYFFIALSDGTALLWPEDPRMEGRNLFSGLPPQYAEIMRTQFETVRRDGSGFLSYWWSRPGELETVHEKTAYIVAFEPYGWIIGLGEYVEDIDRAIQKNILAYIREIRFGEDGYIFVVDNTGKTLMNGAQPDMIDINISDIVDEDGINVFDAERAAAAKPEGDFISYRWKRPSSETVSRKVSFVVGYHPWDWIIGAGFYLDSVEPAIAERSRQARRNFVTNAALLALLLVAGLALSILMAGRLFLAIKAQVHSITSFLSKKQAENEKLDLSLFRISEFEQIAATLNRIVAGRLRTEAELSHVIEISPVAICLFGKGGRIVRTNKGHRDIYGFDVEKDTHITTFLERVLPAAADFPDPSRDVDSAWSGKDFRITKRSPDGAIRKVVVRFQRIGEDSGVMTSSDISSMMAEQERLEADKRILEGLLKEREILIREVHHRVKNNLQIIVSILRLEEGRCEDVSSRNTLNGIMAKVMSIALVHEELYSSGNFTSIQLKEYCAELFRKLLGISPPNQEIEIEMDVEEIPLRMDTMIPLGLILNELFLNSLKHAFGNAPKGTISLSSRVQEGSLVLAYEDSGPGFPAVDKQVRDEGLGISLIEGLSLQIGARMQRPEPGSSRFTFTIPHEGV